jgi:hypothetical protein
MATPILIYGPGSGLGKTTIARHLAETLTSDGVNARLVREEDVASLPALAPYVSAVENGRGDDPRLLISCFERLVDEMTAADGVWILDSVLPGFDWLTSAEVSPDELVSFADAVQDLIRPLAAVVIHVHGDVRIALERAIAERGHHWAEDLAARRTGRGDVDALIHYFERLQATTAELLASWALPLHSIDTTRTPEAEVLRTALDAARSR